MEVNPELLLDVEIIYLRLIPEFNNFLRKSIHGILFLCIYITDISMGFVASGFHLFGPGGRVKGEVWLPGVLV